MKKRSFYGWYIVAAGFMLCLAGVGIIINTSSVFLKPVIETYHFSRGDLSLYFTIAALSMMVMAPVVGLLLERYDIRLVMGVSTLLMCVSFGMYSQCTSLAQFYITSVFMGAGSAGAHIIPVSMMISNWFVEKRGLAMGIVFASSALGGFLFSPLSNWLIANYGWQSAYLILAAIAAVLTIPVALFVVRARPEDKGLLPFGGSPSTATEEGGLTLAESARTFSFWMLVLMFFLLSIVSLGVQQHVIPYFTDLGYSSSFAVNCMALFMGILIVAKILLGAICDRLGLAWGTIVIMAVYTVTIGLLFAASSAWAAVSFAVLFGFANASHTVLPPLFTSACTGLRHFALIFGVLNIVITLGSGIGMPLSGYIYDAYGSYFLAFALYIVLIIITALAGVAAFRKRPVRGLQPSPPRGQGRRCLGQFKIFGGKQ